MAKLGSDRPRADASASVGGNLSLDFANTISWNPLDPTEGEELACYGDLLDWLGARYPVSRAVVRRLRSLSRAETQQADRVLEEARELRGHLHAVFAAYASGAKPPPASTRLLNGYLAGIAPHLSFGSTRVDWDWRIGPPDLSSVLRPVVWEAARLLRSDDLGRVKICAGDRCGWLFVDRSRRTNRRWCDMRDCGNRAKARRHYYRHRRREAG